MCNAIVYSVGSSLAKLDSPISETGGFGISMIMDESSETTTTDPDNWWTPLVRYLENSGHIADKKVR
jgi:hypothetical protein